MSTINASQESDAIGHDGGDRERPDYFDTLLEVLNPFVDELLHQPEFHRFLDLPIELRCTVYEQYFLDNKQSIACKGWPTLQISRSFVRAYAKKKTTTAFLPNICFISKTLQPELLSCLLEQIHLIFEDPEACGGVCVMTAHKVEVLRIVDNIRRVTVLSVNGQKSQLICETARTRGSAAVQSALRARMVNVYLSHLLPVFPRLRDIELAFHAPLICEHPDQARQHADRPKVIPIDAFMQDFDTPPILWLEELQRITIIGASGFYNRNNEMIRGNKKIEGDGKLEDVQIISEIAQQIRNVFKEKGRDVTVKTRLLYGEGKHDEVVLS